MNMYKQHAGDHFHRELVLVLQALVVAFGPCYRCVQQTAGGVLASTLACRWTSCMPMLRTGRIYSLLYICTSKLFTVCKKPRVDFGRPGPFKQLTTREYEILPVTSINHVMYVALLPLNTVCTVEVSLCITPGVGNRNSVVERGLESGNVHRSKHISAGIRRNSLRTCLKVL